MENTLLECTKYYLDNAKYPLAKNQEKKLKFFLTITAKFNNEYTLYDVNGIFNKCKLIEELPKKYEIIVPRSKKIPLLLATSVKNPIIYRYIKKSDNANEIITRLTYECVKELNTYGDKGTRMGRIINSNLIYSLIEVKSQKLNLELNKLIENKVKTNLKEICEFILENY